MAVKWLNSFDESTTDEKKAQLAEKILRLRVNKLSYLFQYQTPLGYSKNLWK